MSDITKIQIESGTYNIKDETARNQINDLSIKKYYFNNRKFILIGDSYGQGYTPDGNVTSWQDAFISRTGLSNTIKKASGGSGFVNVGGGHTFETLLDEVTNDNTVTDIVVLGGYNDQNYSSTQIYNAINGFYSKARIKFPNAQVHIGFVGWSNDSTKLYPLSIICKYYKDCCGYWNIHYINNIEFSLHNYFNYFSSDGIHPNMNGQSEITKNLIQGLLAGSATIQPSFTQIGVTYNNVTGTPFGGDLTCRMLNGLVTISLSSNVKTITFTNTFDGNNGFTEVEIGTINSGYIIGTQYNLTRTTVGVIVHDTNGYFPCTGTFTIRNKKIYIEFADIRDDGNGYRVFDDISQILISGFSNSFDALYC